MGSHSNNRIAQQLISPGDKGDSHRFAARHSERHSDSEECRRDVTSTSLATSADVEYVKTMHCCTHTRKD